MNDPIVGIDLGTSNTVVAHADAGGVVQVLADDGGYKIHPSVVSFHPNGGVVIGAAAKQRKVIDPQNTIYSVKRLIGRAYHAPEVQTAKARAPFQIKEGANQMPMIVTRGGEFAVPEISAIVLDHVRQVASARLGTAVARAVVTVPASFTDSQRSATATAGSIAGLTVVRVLNEPTAAALAYGHARDLREVIAVYDFGGGTFDITILKLADQVYEVLGTAGDSFLGGDDLDEQLVDKMVDKFLAENRLDLRTNEVAMMRLRAVAEQTKIELSRRTRAVVRIDEIAYGPRGKPLDLHIEITRDELIAQVAAVIDRTFPVCREALTRAGVGVDQISDVILVGGSTKIPYVRDQVTRFFRRPPRTDVSPEDAVASGAALQAASLARVLAKPRAAAAKPRRTTPPPVPAVAPARMPVDEPTATDAGPTRSGFYDESTKSKVFDLEPDGAGGGVTMAPLETPPVRRVTAPYPHAQQKPAPGPRPDTSYSVQRSGARESFESFTPAAPQALARISRPGSKSSRPPTEPEPTRPRPPTLPPPIPPVQARRTARGIAPGRDEDFLTEPEATRPRPASVPPADPPPPPPSPAAAPTLIAPAIAPLPAPVAPPSAPTLVAAPAPPQAYPVTPRPAPMVLDVTPHTFGIATVAGFCEELIRRNSRVPAEMKKLFTTSRDRQDLVRIVVCQGESRRLDHNVVIGDLVLANLPPRPRGETSIEVTFEIDSSGILNVRARDAKTGAEQRATLDLVGNMPQADVVASRDRLQQLRR